MGLLGIMCAPASSESNDGRWWLNTCPLSANVTSVCFAAHLPAGSSAGESNAGAVSAEAARTVARGIAKIRVDSDFEFTIFSGAGIPDGARTWVGGEIVANRSKTVHTFGRGTGALPCVLSQRGELTG